MGFINSLTAFGMCLLAMLVIFIIALLLLFGAYMKGQWENQKAKWDAEEKRLALREENMRRVDARFAKRFPNYPKGKRS